MGLLDSIKRDAKKSGQSKGKFIYFREGQKQRIRFLNDMDEGMEITFHDSFELGVNVPCQEHFGKSCPYCEQEGLRTRSQYVWSVWDYDNAEVKLFMYPVNNCTPVPALVAMYDNYGTLTDRDYVISVTGKQQNKTFSVVPMDKVKFRNDKAKPFSKKSILDMLNKAYPADNNGGEDEDDYKPSKKHKSKKEDIDLDDDYDADEIEKELFGEDYESMSPKELFKLCEDKGIECKPKKPAKYYINLLEEYDKAQDDWGDEEDEDDDEWEDDDE